MACDTKCRKCGIGIMPRQRIYRCIKCNAHVLKSEIEEKRCPLCLAVQMLHKGCGGAVREVNLLDRVRIR